MQTRVYAVRWSLFKGAAHISGSADKKLHEECSQRLQYVSLKIPQLGVWLSDCTDPACTPLHHPLLTDPKKEPGDEDGVENGSTGLEKETDLEEEKDVFYCREMKMGSRMALRL